MTATWQMVAAERTALCDALDTLSEDQWQHPSALRGWLVRHVVAHLVWPLETSLLRLGLQALRHGGSLRATDAVAEGDRRPGPELARTLRLHADTPRFRFPGRGIESPLAETVLHALDVRLPLGLGHAIPGATARVVLDTLVSPTASRGYSPPHRFDGLRLRATDLDWAHGDGPGLEGPVDALLITLAGRGIAIDRLAGEGVEILKSRRGKGRA